MLSVCTLLHDNSAEVGSSGEVEAIDKTTLRQDALNHREPLVNHSNHLHVLGVATEVGTITKKKRNKRILSFISPSPQIPQFWHRLQD